MSLGEIAGAIEIGEFLHKVQKFIKSKHTRPSDISLPNDRKLFLQEFVMKHSLSSRYKLTGK